MEAFVNEHVSAEYAGQALALLQLKKLYCNNVTLNTEDDINHVLALATAAGVSSDILSEFASAKNFYEDALASGNAGRNCRYFLRLQNEPFGSTGFRPVCVQ